MRTAMNKLKALFDFLRMPDDRFVSRQTAIHDKLLGNPAFPNPPVDLAAFLAAITTFAASWSLRLMVLNRQERSRTNNAKDWSKWSAPGPLRRSGFE
jgi:hypothetical protein